jgi:hypothetical protein
VAGVAAARETVRLRFGADRVIAQLEEIYAGLGLRGGTGAGACVPSRPLGSMIRPVILLLLGPLREAASGVSMYPRLLFASGVADEFCRLYSEMCAAKCMGTRIRS